MFSERWKRDLSYYDVHDTYSLPSLLLKARRNLNTNGIPLRMDHEAHPTEDEDELFHSTMKSCTGILHLALRRFFQPFHKFIGRDNISVHDDEESHVKPAEDSTEGADMSPPFTAYEIEMEDGRHIEAFEVAVEHKWNIFENYIAEERGDLTSFLLSETCASSILVWSEETRFIVITESCKNGTRSLKQWYRKILSDIALTDSIIVGHPYYWHPVVRRRLSRAVRHFKKLYDVLEKRDTADKEMADAPWLLDSEPLLLPSSTSDNELEYISPRDKTKVILTGKTERDGNVVENLCMKWSEYSQSLRNHMDSDGDHDPGDIKREKLQKFLASLTEKIGASPKDAISLSLGPYFRMENIGPNISTVKACLPRHAPIHTSARWKSDHQIHDSQA